jgi:hypothetical protein
MRPSTRWSRSWAGEQELALGVAGRVHQERVVVPGEQRAAQADAEQLLPQVLERAEQQTDRAGPAAGQGRAMRSTL